jgi:hypothetical protein
VKGLGNMWKMQLIIMKYCGVIIEAKTGYICQVL